MGITDEILEQTMTLFERAGVVVEEDGVVLMLGLESTRERNLEEMVYEGGRWHNRGWLKHVKPRMLGLLDILKERGFKADPVPWWGYPGGDVMQFKRLAVTAGLGQQGKHTLVLDPIFGGRLRLAAMRTDAPLTPTGSGVYEQRENPLCQSCNFCIDVCPVEGLLEPYRLLDPDRCLMNLKREPARRGKCHEACRVICPIGRER